MLNKPKTPLTDYQEYKKNVMARLMSLGAEETEHLKNLYGKPELVTLGKIVGEDVTKALADGINSIAQDGKQKAMQQSSVKRRGLATR